MKTTLRNSGLLLIVIAVAFIWIAAFTLAQKQEDIPSKGLEAAIRQTLNQPKGMLEPHLLRNIRSLDARGFDIDSLEGIELLTGLEALNLRENRISDIAPLAALRGLKSLNLRDNHISDISPLANLELLEDINLRNNYIVSVEPLSGLELLRSRLYLEGNPIADFKPVASFYHLIEDTDIGTLPPLFSQQGGFYSDDVVLELSSPYSDAHIYYTTDGSEPTRQSTRYTEPIVIQPRSGERSRIAQIETTPHGFQRPTQVHLATVVRAKVFREELQPSQSYTQTYFVDPIDTKLAVVSITTDRDHLFDYNTGIYVPGVHYKEVGQPWEHLGNYTQRGAEWERPANLEFYEPDGTMAFSHQVGLRIHGGATRTNPLKSLRVYAKSSYGVDSIRYPVFEDSSAPYYKRLVLRASGNDHDGAYMRDALMQKLVSHTDLDTQAYRPVIVYINGEYWGIHDLRERIDGHYLETKYGIDAQNIDLLSANAEIEEGSDAHYKEMLEYIKANGLEEELHYRQIQTMMDTDNYILYQAANIYYNNTDWPGNNIKFWREQTAYRPDAPYGRDGRWRWIMFDTDFGFNLYGSNHQSNDTMSFAAAPNGGAWPNPPWSTMLFRELLKNEEFRHDFLNTFADLMNVEFQAATVLDEISAMTATLAIDMLDHIARWGRPYSYQSWQDNLANMRSFATERTFYMRNHLIRYFGLSGNADVTLLPYDHSKGYVYINSVQVPESDQSWTGNYFKDIPIKLVAVPKPGYRFAGWRGDLESDGDELLVTLDREIRLEALFH